MMTTIKDLDARLKALEEEERYCAEKAARLKVLAERFADKANWRPYGNFAIAHEGYTIALVEVVGGWWRCYADDKDVSEVPTLAEAKAAALAWLTASIRDLEEGPPVPAAVDDDLPF
jgi:hypothetical protein